MQIFSIYDNGNNLVKEKKKPGTWIIFNASVVEIGIILYNIIIYNTFVYGCSLMLLLAWILHPTSYLQSEKNSLLSLYLFVL